MALRDTGLEDDPEAAKDISLPGVRRGEMSTRRSRPEVRVHCVRFSPTGPILKLISLLLFVVLKPDKLRSSSNDAFDLL